MPTPFDVWSVQLEFVDCVGAPILIPVDPNDVQPHLPQGFTADGTGPTGTVQVIFYKCKGIIVDNQTVLAPVTWAATVAFVHADKKLEEGADVLRYVFELFTDNDAHLEILQRAGFPARLAQIKFEYTDTDVRASVSVGSTVWYEGVGNHHRDDSLVFSDVFRYFHVPANSSPVWADSNETYQIRGDFDGIAITVHEGFLKNIKPGNAGYLAGWTQEISSRYILTFHQQK